MAYVDHAATFVAGIAPVRAPADFPAGRDEPKRGFSALEWSVIVLARKDRLSSLAAPGALARALGGLFGLGRQSNLADPKLEALRRTAVHVWHRGYRLPVSQIKAFLAAGFTSDQLDALLGSVSAARQPARAFA